MKQFTEEIPIVFCDLFCETDEDMSGRKVMRRRSSKLTCTPIEVELGRILGSGGFGKVYEGLWKGKKIAVKQLTSKAKLKNANAPRESLQAESLLLEYRHRNLVKTLAILSSDLVENCMVIMEFAGERNLQSVIDDEKVTFTHKRRVQIALDIGSGLAYMHEQGLAHLDIKPANILVNEAGDGECKICDFGCCQYVDTEENNELQPPSPTKTALTGTFAYRAPELLKGEFPTTKADVYSLGVCLWQLLVREQPYGLESHFVIIFGVVQKNLRPQFPVELLQDRANLDYIKLTTSLWHGEASKRPAAKDIVCTLRNW